MFTSMRRASGGRRNASLPWLLGLAWCLLAGSAPAAPPPAEAPTLARAIDAFIAQPQFAHADWGIAVRSLATGRTLYAHHAERLFVPASGAKLFSAGLARGELGATTRIATTLYATSERVTAAGVLRGDLILYGRGDPSLGLGPDTRDWSERFAAALAARGVRRVEGDLIADATYFSGLPVGNGWEANDLQTWYGAVPSALNVAGNRVQVEVSREGQRCCAVGVTPAAAGVRVDNRTGDTAGQALGLYRPLGASTLYAVGSLPPGVQRKTYLLSMPDPARTAAVMLREAMRRQGITLTGHIKVLQWPEPDPALSRRNAVVIASVESPTVAELVDRTLKQSDNLFAQLLWLQAGVVAAARRDCAEPTPPDSSAGWAECALRGLLAQAGIAPGAASLIEGTGLARQDLVTPDAFIRWLAWTMTQPWGAALWDALPVAGIDGTLEARLRNDAATGNLRAKTGTLNHAYTLAGFVTDAAGEPLVFALMLNRYARWAVAREHPEAPSPTAALDAIANLLAQHGRAAAPEPAVAPGGAPPAH